MHAMKMQVRKDDPLGWYFHCGVHNVLVWTGDGPHGQADAYEAAMGHACMNRHKAARPRSIREAINDYHNRSAA